MFKGKTREITCICGCGRKKMVRVADINRGWGKFYSKSCKARHQESRTGQCSAYYARKKVSRKSKMTDDEFYYATTAFNDPDALGQWD